MRSGMEKYLQCNLIDLLYSKQINPIDNGIYCQVNLNRMADLRHLSHSIPPQYFNIAVFYLYLL